MGVKTSSSMPFSTAVSYSMRTISAKKGRAILTAAVSAISMIGIAAIVVSVVLRAADRRYGYGLETPNMK